MSSALIPKEAPKKRPPIVVVVGHVDHGKTTLLDSVRKQKIGQEEKAVAEGESGGITQHIGAYEVLHNEEKITFVDTPGHEAFSAMRLRGTSVADVALLIVAADDGVKPQTKEALKHILEADIPYIVVINKTDLPDAQPERVKNELAQEGVLVEGRGGQVPVVEISALNGTGIEDLLEIITLVADLEELTYDAVQPAQGYVLESHRDAQRGITTNLVLTNGTLRKGDLLVCGPAYGKIKMMEDFTGKTIKGAVPSSPVQVIGVSDLSVAGDPCQVVESETDAEEAVAKYKEELEKRQAELQIEPGEQDKVLPLIIKADVQGSLDAIVGALRQIQSDRVGLKVVRCECGAVGEDDMKLAQATKASIFAFRVGANKEAETFSENKEVAIHRYDVIYELVEAVRGQMAALIEAEIRKEEIGRLKVLAIFRTEKTRMIVGGKITTGKLVKGAKVEIRRGGELVGEGTLVRIQKEDEQADEATKGNEVGIQYEGPVKLQEGDVVSAYTEERVYPEL